MTNGKIHKELIDKLIALKQEYQNNESVYLYDLKFDGKYKTFSKIHPHILQSWDINYNMGAHYLHSNAQRRDMSNMPQYTDRYDPRNYNQQLQIRDMFDPMNWH